MITTLHEKDYARTPWKNGLGWTDQIAIEPPNADLRKGNFLWRVSTARISQSASFSNFPDHDRILVVLDGAGVRLSHTFVEGEEPEIVELGPLEPYEFPGDVPTYSQLRDGPIQDFSIFLRKGEVSAQCEIVTVEEGQPMQWTAQDHTSFLLVAEGRLKIGETELAKGETFRIEADDCQLESAAPITNLVCVRIGA